MNIYFFDHETMDNYWSCNNRTPDEWRALANPSLGIGLLYIILGLTFLVIYIPCWIALLKSDLMKYSAYKFMALLGCIDIVGLINATFYSGLASLFGLIHCMAPTLNYVAGVLAYFGWIMSSTICVILATSRCIDFISPKIGRMLFVEKRTYYWFAIPFFYGLHILLIANPCVFNAYTYAYSFDPFYGLPERHGKLDNEHYPHLTLAIHNTTVPVILVINYLVLWGVTKAQTQKIHGMRSRHLGKAQRNVLIQTFLIFSVISIGALLYSYSNFFYVNQVYTICGQIGLFGVHGLPGLTYFMFNKTIRNNVFAMFRKKQVSVLHLHLKVGPGLTPMPGIPYPASNTQAY